MQRLENSLLSLVLLRIHVIHTLHVFLSFFLVSEFFLHFLCDFHQSKCPAQYKSDEDPDKGTSVSVHHKLLSIAPGDRTLERAQVVHGDHADEVRDERSQRRWDEVEQRARLKQILRELCE